MVSTRHLRFLGILGLLAPLGCVATDGGEPVGFAQSAGVEAKCDQSEPHDMLIAQLMHISLSENFSLTHLYIDGEGLVQSEVDIEGTGTQGQLNVINGVVEINEEDDDEMPEDPDLIAGQGEDPNDDPNLELARSDIANALDELKTKTSNHYTVAEHVYFEDACEDVPAWPEGVILPKTESWKVVPGEDEESQDAWKWTHKKFGKYCPLVKDNTNVTLVDPAGDGSTNDPPSSTVSANGVKALSNGLCPAYAPYGTYCKLSYATGVNWTGRKCKYWYSAKRCVLY